MKMPVFTKKAIKDKKLQEYDLLLIQSKTNTLKYNKKEKWRKSPKPGLQLKKNGGMRKENEMTFEEHCQESITLFGKPYEEVHKWLDEFQKAPGIGMKHRKFRHHQVGIKEALKLFGEEAERVARRHIISDLKQEGWREGEHPFPRDEDHYVEMGLF